MTHDPQWSDPPPLASKLLRACCRPARREEIEGDLFELYARRVVRSGVAAARRRYWRDVLDVCVRQLCLRLLRGLRRPAWSGALRLYPLRIIASLVSCAALLAVPASAHPWAIVATTVLFVMQGVIEILVYIFAIRGMVTRRRARRAPRDG